MGIAQALGDAVAVLAGEVQVENQHIHPVHGQVFVQIVGAVEAPDIVRLLAEKSDE